MQNPQIQQNSQQNTDNNKNQPDIFQNSVQKNIFQANSMKSDDQHQQENEVHQDKELKQALAMKKETFRVEIRRKITSSTLNSKRFKVDDKGGIILIQSSNNNSRSQCSTKFNHKEELIRFYKEFEKQIDDAFVMQEKAVSVLEEITNEIKNQSTSPPLPIYELFQTQIPQKLMQILHHAAFNDQLNLMQQFETVIKNILFSVSNWITCTQEVYAPLVQQCQLLQIIDRFLEKKISNQDSQNSIMLILGNLAGEGDQYRFPILQSVNNLMQKFCFLIVSSTSEAILNDALWVIKGIYKHPMPPESIKEFEYLAPIIKQILDQNTWQNISDQKVIEIKKDIVKEALQVVQQFCEYDDSINIQFAQNQGIHKNVIQLLSNDDSSIKYQALKTIGTFAYGKDNQCQILIDSKLFDVLIDFLKADDQYLKIETCWILSNFSASNLDIVKQMKDKEIFSIIAKQIVHERPNIQKESMFILCNATESEDASIIKYLLNLGLLEFIQRFLNPEKDQEYIIEMLEAIENILSCLKSDASYTLESILKKMSEIQLTNTIEQLQYHSEKVIYDICAKIISENFNYE